MMLLRTATRVAQTAVLAAAGLGGWLAVERFAFPAIAAAVTLDEDGPWPSEFARPTSTWDSFSLTYSADNATTHVTSTDATTSRTRITYFADDGVTVESDVELRGNDAWERAAGTVDWIQLAPEEITGHVILGLGEVNPRHVSSVLPTAAQPFATVETQPIDGDATRFVVNIDRTAFQRADPVEFARWNSTFDWYVQEIYDLEPFVWTLDVRDDGYIVRWEGRSDSVETWSELPEDLVFESPLKPLSPPVPVEDQSGVDEN